MKALILAVSKGGVYFCIVYAGHLSISSHNNPLPFFAPCSIARTTFPRLPSSGFWRGPTNKRGNVRGLGVRREALIFLPFLYLLCGSTSGQSAHGFMVPALDHALTVFLAPATQLPQPALVTPHLCIVSLGSKDGNLLLLLISKLPCHTLLCFSSQLKPVYKFLVLKFLF